MNFESGNFEYIYQYNDHLGNARVNYAYSSGSKNPIVIPAGVLIKDESHYYPFGLKHLNYNVDFLTYQEIEDDIVLYPPLNSSAKLMYNYKYNGKELQEELGLNMYDYGARNYDPALGRWMNIDPLAEVSRRWTPYNYCYNNPVVFVDPDGMKAKEVPDAAFSDWAGGPSADNQEAAFKGMHSNIGGHYDPNNPSASNNHGGGDKGGKSWFRRGWDSLFGGKKEKSVNAEPVEGYKVLDDILDVSTTELSASLKVGQYIDVGIKRMWQLSLGEYREEGLKLNLGKLGDGPVHFRAHKFVAGFAMKGVGAQVIYDYGDRTTAMSLGAYGITVEHVFGGSYGYNLLENWFVGMDFTVSAGISLGGEAGIRSGFTDMNED